MVRLTILFASIALFAAAPAGVEAAVKVNLSKMHLCCGACVKAVEKAVADVEGIEITINQKQGTVALQAEKGETLQTAVDRIAAAGFHASTDSDKIKVKQDSGAKKGRVSRIELSGVHNCCGGCNRAVKKAIGSVKGVVADTAKPRSQKLVVEGEFDALELVQALEQAGFHVRVVK